MKVCLVSVLWVLMLFILVILMVIKLVLLGRVEWCIVVWWLVDDLLWWAGEGVGYCKLVVLRGLCSCKG